MIQIRQIRVMKNGKEAEKPLDKDILVLSHKDLFSEIDTLLSKIEPDERYNLFYTRGHTPGGFQREWHGQDIIPFDIDDLRLVDGKLDPKFEPDYEAILGVVFKVLGCEREKSVVILSGNGVQILVQPERPIREKKFFADYAHLYGEICSEINHALKSLGIPGKADPAVFSVNGVLRLPGTENRKPGKEPRRVVLLNSKLERQPFRITPPAPGLENAEPWSVSKGDALPAKTTVYSKMDEPAVEAGCEFLKEARTRPEDISEQQWYAMLSIVGRFKDPEKIHEYSLGHPGYSRQGTEAKARYALSASGPRTCEGINKIWAKCSTCPNQGRVTSPVSLRERSFIATEETGFHQMSKGGSLIPVPSDLKKYFEKEFPFVSSPESGIVFVYNGKFYTAWKDQMLRGFAEQNYDPPVAEKYIQEFKHSVTRSNLFENRFFDESPIGFVNFQNGVYSIKDQELYPHTKDKGFLYVLPYEYQPEALCPTFDSFLDTLSQGDKEVQEVLKEFIGYTICDVEYRFQKSLILLGEGGNGKSTLINIVRELFGDVNISNLSLDNLSLMTAISELEGKLLNLCEELPTDKFGETGQFKNLFGGTTTSKKLYKDVQSLRNRAKFIFSGNKMPLSRDSSNGFLRRLIFVPLTARFEDGVNADPFILEKIKLELPGIFNSVLRAYERAKKRGALLDSKAGRAVHANYAKSIDPVKAWMDDYLIVDRDFVPGESSFILTSELFVAYQTYRTAHNDKAGTKESFIKHLASKIPDWDKRHARKSINKERHYIAYGLRLEKNKDVSPEF